MSSYNTGLFYLPDHVKCLIYGTLALNEKYLSTKNHAVISSERCQRYYTGCNKASGQAVKHADSLMLEVAILNYRYDHCHLIIV